MWACRATSWTVSYTHLREPAGDHDAHGVGDNAQHQDQAERTTTPAKFFSDRPNHHRVDEQENRTGTHQARKERRDERAELSPAHLRDRVRIAIATPSSNTCDVPKVNLYN